MDKKSPQQLLKEVIENSPPSIEDIGFGVEKTEGGGFYLYDLWDTSGRMPGGINFVEETPKDQVNK
jgi:hypothetical protein